MAFTFNGLSGQEVTISGGINPSPTEAPAGSTKVQYHGVFTNSTVTLHTVTAGKKLYITHASVHVNADTAGFNVQLKADDIVFLAQTLSYGYADRPSNAIIDFSIPLEIAETKTLKYTSDVASKGTYLIIGYEV